MKPFWILLILSSYFSILLLISWLTGRKADNQGFFLGNRKSPWMVVAFGMIGASLSGVTFISVPGWVGSSQWAYMQMVLGYLVGYQVIIYVLLPIYYRLELTSIYGYLEKRFGFWSYKSGVVYFLLSRTFGSSARLFIVATVLQLALFDSWKVPFAVTVLITMALIWLYTFKGGIKTIIWTDTLQTFFMLAALLLTISLMLKDLNLGMGDAFAAIKERGFARIFFWDDFAGDRRHFIKYFLGGMFITITMTGLDQDMMQKNLSCKTLKDSQKNMNWFSFMLVPVNLLFLFLGALLYLFAQSRNIPLPVSSDDLFPLIATQGYVGSLVTIFFIIGLVAAAFSSADSALTALTTSITVDLLGRDKRSEERIRTTRFVVHIILSLVMLLVILLFRALNDRSVIDALFTIAGYTYGPLLGLFGYGLLTKNQVNDRWVPLVVLISPALTFFIQHFSSEILEGYVFGFELLLMNGLITALLLFIFKKKPGRKPGFQSESELNIS